MTAVASLGLPYEVRGEVRLCRCHLDSGPRSRHRKVERAIAEAAGTWNIICAFYGDHPLNITVFVVDVRDGTIVWRDGRHQREDQDGKLFTPGGQDGLATATAGAGARAVGARRAGPGRRGER